METWEKAVAMASHLVCSRSEMVHHRMLLWPNTERERVRHRDRSSLQNSTKWFMKGGFNSYDCNLPFLLCSPPQSVYLNLTVGTRQRVTRWITRTLILNMFSDVSHICFYTIKLKPLYMSNQLRWMGKILRSHSLFEDGILLLSHTILERKSVYWGLFLNFSAKGKFFISPPKMLLYCIAFPLEQPLRDRINQPQ